MYDLAVVGGGAMGSACAYQAVVVAPGTRVVLLEAQPLHSSSSSANDCRQHLDHGGSSGESRIIRATDPNAAYAALAHASMGEWTQLQQRADALAPEKSRPRILTVTGSLDFGRRDTPAMASMLQAAKSGALVEDARSGPSTAVEVIDSAEELSRRFPALRNLHADTVGLFSARGGGILNPAAAIPAMRAVAAAGGAELRGASRVVSLRMVTDEHAHCVELSLATGEVLRAARVVLATGAWTQPLANRLGLTLPPLKVWEVTYAWLRVTPPGAATATADGVGDDGNDYAPGRLPVWRCLDPDARCYGFPLFERAEQGLLKVAPYGHETLDVWDDPRQRRGRPNPAYARATIRFAWRLLRGEQARRDGDVQLEPRTCLYSVSPDKLPLIDQLPGWHGRLAVCAGFSGAGFKNCVSVGKMVAEAMLCGGQWPAMFSLQRPGLQVGPLEPAGGAADGRLSSKL